ncbi:MAG: hypothetical protein AAGJ31_04330, partial [Verrucomicrobiota bacterium]
YDRVSNTWSEPRRVSQSSFGQDRRSTFVTVGNEFFLCWPSDLRKTKAAQESGIYLAKIPGDMELPLAKAIRVNALEEEPFAPSQTTPEREVEEHHAWEHGGRTYQLYWGDLHRHTDVSNCRTGFDGCIVEHFRYAYDIAKLDFLGTSDHTDIGKMYHPYEWWHNQRMHDALHSPERFTSLYAYEREQKWPWGHRNIVFAQRGGPLVYIKRTTYRNSPWQETFPVPPGITDIHPNELWKILKDYGKPVSSISHTGATGMGTDWSGYDRPIDWPTETIVEIFQGARVSYEGLGAPQPTAGLRPNEGYTIASGREPADAPPAPIQDFGKFNAGVYQNALIQGHRLGVFANSDHISQHVSYGGVYCEEFTREGIIQGFESRLTIAATDKIFAQFTINGKPMGSLIPKEAETQIAFYVNGTAALKRITIVRNEQDWKVFDGLREPILEQQLTDEAPAEGENRYYLRVEQQDGNMAWCSPIWVTESPS